MFNKSNLKLYVVSIICILTISPPAIAGTEIKVTVQNPEGSPVNIADSFSELNTDLRYSYGGSSIARMVWVGRLDYTNTSQRIIKAVRFHWDLMDVFGQLVDPVDVVDEEGIGVEEFKAHEWNQLVNENVAEARVYISEVVFDDGTYWNSKIDNESTSYEEKTRLLERQRLLNIYKEKGTEGLIKAVSE